MGLKKIIISTFVVVGIGAALFLVRPKMATVEPLRFCTWSNYYPDSFIEEFTRKTGIPVELSFISSNEELLAKFKAGATGFDLIQPSDYLVRQMAKLEMLQPLNHAELPNLSHIEDYYRSLSYDPGMKYSVPFTWGTTGLAINTERVPIPADGQVSWELLYRSPDPKHTSMLDDMREVFGGVLLWKGLSLNSTDKKTLEMVKAEVARAKAKVLLFSSEPRALLEQGEVTIAHIFSSDGITAAAKNPKIRYFIPKEGATIYTDNFSIPKSSVKVREAHAFINFFLDPDVGRRMALENHLATPNRTVRAALPKEITSDPSQYPGPDVMKRLFFLEDIGETLSLLSRMWTELKSS